MTDPQEVALTDANYMNLAFMSGKDDPGYLIVGRSHFYLLREDHILHVSILDEDKNDVILNRLPLNPTQRFLKRDKDGDVYLKLHCNDVATPCVQNEVFFDAYFHALKVLGKLHAELVNKGYSWGPVDSPEVIPRVK